MLILIAGLPGSGKSTVARAYIARYGGIHINSDILRGTMGLRGHYQAGEKEKVYAAMLVQTREVLRSGAVAVVDSTFFRQDIRAPFEQIAADFDCPVFRVVVQAREETVRRRLQVPRPDSEADFAVYEKIRDQSEPWPAPHLTLYTDTAAPDELAGALHQYIIAHHDN